MTAAFDAWLAIAEVLQGGDYQSTPAGQVDVRFGLPGDWLGLESVVVSGLIDADDEERLAGCVWKESLQATVYVSTGLYHETADAARDRLAELTAAALTQMASNSPPAAYPSVKKWRAQFRRASVIPHADGGGWRAQSELSVACETNTS